ncbi:hypothetical protein Efla_001696 [Eimeria flavescens]
MRPACSLQPSSLAFMFARLSFLSLLAFPAVVAAAAAAADPAAAGDGDAAAVPAAAAAAAALEAGFMRLRPISKTPNAVFSPHSLLSVLALAAEGASGKCLAGLESLLGENSSSSSSSSSRMREALLLGGDRLVADADRLERLQGRLSGPEGEGPTLSVLSRLFADESIESREAFQLFKEQLQARLPSGVQTADFSFPRAAAAEMNELVAAVTRGKITSLISPQTVASSRLVLLNALYFKSQWLSPFFPGESVQGLFQPAGAAAGGEGAPTQQEARQVTFMQQTFEPGSAAFIRESGVEVVGLPFAYPGAWLFLYKPEDAAAFERRVAAEEEGPLLLTRLAEGAKGALRRADTTLHLSLPKFELNADNHRFDAIGLLQQMGLGECMRPGRPSSSSSSGSSSSGAEGEVGAFDKMGGAGSGLFVATVSHQAVIRVDEFGAEAAAATAASVTDSAFLGARIEHVTFDKPFFFELRLQTVEKANAEEDYILFAGRVGDPTVA